MVIMNKYIKDMMHERELIYDAKKAIHKEDKKYKAAGQMKGSVMHMGHSPMKNVNKGYAPEVKSPIKMGHSPLTKHCTSALRYGSPMKQEDPKDELTKEQKLKMAGEAIGEDVSFEVKTMDDPRSSRRIVEIKKQLEKENPEKYEEIYGK